MAKTSVRWVRLGRIGARAVGVVILGGLLAALTVQISAADTPSPVSGKAPPPRKASSVLGNSDDADKVHSINVQLVKGWKDNKLTPSARCSDHEFLRRASLDIIGRIPTFKEMERFVKDPESTRRSLLIDRLLKTEDYANNWANIWTVWLLTRAGAESPARKIYHEQMHRWLKDQFAKEGVSYKDLVVELLTATGKTNENGAVNYVLAHLGEPSPRGEEDKEGKYQMVPITSRTTRLFLGIQTQCAQCHKHPFNPNLEQRYFWGINAFFRQVDTPRGRPAADDNRMAMATVLEVKDNPNLNPGGKVFFEQRNGVLLATKAEFALEKDDEGKEIQRTPAKGGNRRQELAKFITDSKYFPKAYVNRMWAHFFGRGFTNPVDDFNPENEVSHPELLNELAAEFVHYGYDPRRLIRWICNSDAYSLSCVANKTNDKPEDERLFSRMLLKAMSPEELFESLMVATQADMFESKENLKKLSDDWMKKLTTSFGDDEGNEVTFNGTVVQALMMMNGPDINKAITRMMSADAVAGAITNKEKGSVALTLVKRGSPGAIINHLYYAALNRPPTAKETVRIIEISRTAPVKTRDKLSFWQDLFWALLNSNEFILNH
jgi:hypothetical protein